jgi:hypothetical protein
MTLFVSYKIDDVGTGNFIVSRLMIDLPKIVELYVLDEELNQSLVNIIYDTAYRIITCNKIYQSLYDEVSNIDEEIRSNKYVIVSQRETINRPHIISLNPNCENFLYHAKSTLRELIRVVEILYGIELKTRDFDKISDFLSKNQENNIELAKFLQLHNERWIKYLVEMRNYIEHPYNDKVDRKLEIGNYRVDFKNQQFVPPIWRFYLKKKLVIEDYILNTMNSYICNLVLFCENVVLLILDNKHSVNRIMGFEERHIDYTYNRDLKRFDY